MISIHHRDSLAQLNHSHSYPRCLLPNPLIICQRKLTQNESELPIILEGSVTVRLGIQYTAPLLLS